MEPPDRDPWVRGGGRAVAIGQRRDAVGNALLAAADAALYQAKEQGRDCVVLDRGGADGRGGEALELTSN